MGLTYINSSMDNVYECTKFSGLYFRKHINKWLIIQQIAVTFFLFIFIDKYYMFSLSRDVV